jgi:hypothetical protein
LIRSPQDQGKNALRKTLWQNPLRDAASPPAEPEANPLNKQKPPSGVGQLMKPSQGQSTLQAASSRKKLSQLFGETL